MRKLLLIVLTLLVLYIVFRPSIKENFATNVAVMPNEYVQTNDCTWAGNNLDNRLSAQFQPDNMDLKQFFKFTPEIAKYYPQSNRIVNNYYAVPRVI